MPGCVTALIQEYNYVERDANSRVTIQFPGEFFAIGYYDPAQRLHTQTFEIFGVPVSITSETLHQLTGRTLAMKTITVRQGWFRKATKAFLVAT